MSRTPVTVRAAVADDLPVLRELWSDILRRGSVEDQLADVRRVLVEVQAHADQAIMVAEYDGEVAGAVHLSATTLTPLNLEPTVQAVSPHVLPQFRRRGVGSALIEAAVRFAEAQGIGTISTAAVASSRDANRFMARLSFTPQATLRAATTVGVRAKLSGRRSAGRAAVRHGGSRHIDRVLAARRISRENVAG
jgi:ribosomal protein S18 acetylase RimI-like enzyme